MSEEETNKDEPSFAEASAGEEHTTQPEESNIDYKEAWMRATADYQNLKKEMASKQSEYVKYANENMLEDLLPVIEHFEQGLKYIPEEYQSADWMIGFVQIKKMLDEFTERNGLVKIKTVGESFNTDLHEAAASRKEAGKKTGEILEEVMGGYTLNGKVIKPAKVIVAE